ncbi:MAG TPA: tetratricopeptide repeat protein [Pyrinomonadaceae bacterium]|nr:tetratricopeptide repeat protein [Pyrinomonadaceae bacterium]
MAKTAGAIFTALLLIIIFTVLLSDSFTKHSVTLESFSANSELRAEGYDEQVIASRFAQDLRLMEKGARSIKKSKVLAPPLPAELPDMEVLSAKISVKGIVKYLQAFAPFRYLRRRLLGVNPLRVSGEAGLQGRQVRIDLRLAKDLDGGTRVEPKTFTGDVGDLDRLLTQASESIMASAEPYLFASYLYQSKRTGEAEANIQYCLNSDPSQYSHLALTLWGLILIDQKKYDEAIAKFEEATQQPKSGEQYRELAAAYNDWGLALLAKHAPEEAIAKFREAIAHDPNYALAYNNYGKALLDKNDHEGAKQNLRKALSIDAYYARAYYNLAFALEDENLDDAVQNYRAATQADPDFIEAYCNLALLQTERLTPPRNEEAIETLNKALAKNKEAACAYNAMGSALLNQREISQAIDAYEQAVKLYAAQRGSHEDEQDFMDSYAKALNNLGAAYEEANDYGAAAKNYQAAFDLDPHYYYALTGKGDVLRKGGRFDAAAAAYQTVLDAREANESSRFVAYKGMGLLLRARCRACPLSQKRKEAASSVSMFEAALELRPNDEEVQGALEEAKRELKALDGKKP